jgi:hypothetical protein
VEVESSKYEDQNINQTALRALQDHPPKRRRDDHLFESEAQAKAGVME